MYYGNTTLLGAVDALYNVNDQMGVELMGAPAWNGLKKAVVLHTAKMLNGNYGGGELLGGWLTSLTKKITSPVSNAVSAVKSAATVLPTVVNAVKSNVSTATATPTATSSKVWSNVTSRVAKAAAESSAQKAAEAAAKAASAASAARFAANTAKFSLGGKNFQIQMLNGDPLTNQLFGFNDQLGYELLGGWWTDAKNAVTSATHNILNVGAKIPVVDAAVERFRDITGVITGGKKAVDVATTVYDNRGKIILIGAGGALILYLLLRKKK